MEKSIVFAGFGGQGVLTAGLICAYAANAPGRYVLWMPAYGGQMRGGKSYSLVKMDDRPVCHPDIEELDVLVAMNLPSLEAFCKYVKPDGCIFVNTDTIPEERIPDSLKDIAIRIPFASIASLAGNPRGANIAALGAMIRKTRLFDYEAFEKSLLKFFEEKGKGAYAELNSRALKEGYTYEVK